MVLVYYNVIFSHFTACNEWLYFITRRLYIFLSVYVYIYSLPFKIAHSEPYHSPKSENAALYAAIQIRLFRPISPPSMSHGEIPLPDKLIYRALDSRYTALIICGDLLVRHIAELMPPLPVPKIAVNHDRLLRDFVTIDHFEFPHRHHYPFFVRSTSQARIRFSQRRLSPRRFLADTSR